LFSAGSPFVVIKRNRRFSPRSSFEGGPASGFANPFKFEDCIVHILTKIFIVLVSLLAVLLVPLVVVYAHNENSFKTRYADAELKAGAAADALKAEQARNGAEIQKKEAEISDLRAMNSNFSRDKDTALASVRQLESQLATAESGQAEIKSRLDQIALTLVSGQALSESLIGELRGLRTQVAASEKEKVQLDEALRDVTAQLENAENARRALAEELARLKDEHSQAMTQLSEAVSKGFGSRGDVAVGALRPDKSLSAKVVSVQRSNNQILAEIDAGSTDGVKVDWAMTIGRQGEFVANLKIINVDINRATGIVTLEERSGKKVEINDMAYATAGRN